MKSNSVLFYLGTIGNDFMKEIQAATSVAMALSDRDMPRDYTNVQHRTGTTFYSLFRG